MAYNEEPRRTNQGTQTWIWIVVAAIVVVVALLIYFFFFRPTEEVVAPGNGVDVVEPVDDEVEVAEPADDVEVLEPADEAEDGAAVEEEDVEAVPATVEEGAWVVPGRRPFQRDGGELMAA